MKAALAILDTTTQRLTNVGFFSAYSKIVFEF